MLAVGSTAYTAEAVTLDNALKALALCPASYIKKIIIAEKIRYTIAKSEIMIEPITVSIGISSFEKYTLNQFNSPEELSKAIYTRAKDRSILAKNNGMNQICAESTYDPDYVEKIGTILLVDTDKTHITILATLLEQANFTILTAQDGDTALQLIESKIPDMVISEIMLPKMDGFMVCEHMQMLSTTKNTIFILVSFQKDLDTIQRAFSLDIEHFFQKPYILSELTGLIIHKFKQQQKKALSAKK